LIDPDGRDDYYYNEKGLQIYLVENQSPDRNFVIKTTQTTSEIYNDKTSNSSQRGTVQSISLDVATLTEKEISAGNLTGDHMKNIVQIENSEKMEAMLNSIKDDGSGGTDVANNKEYSGSFGGENGVFNLKESASQKPSAGGRLITEGNTDFHSHPSGTEKVSNGTAMCAQPPSKQDISVAGNTTKYVVGMRNQTIYIYNNKGVIATIPVSTFKK
jgi:hypothetical protein